MNPYFWQGDTLMHVDGHVVAHAGEFPTLRRLRLLREKERIRRERSKT